MREIARGLECVVEDILATLGHRNTPTCAKKRSMPNLTLIYAHLATIVPAAYFAARAHNIKRHKFYMLGVYLGAVLIAGVFTFTPGRLMHTWFLL
jgi:hypothetical protein